MSEPTKDALELAKVCAAEITEAFNVAAYNMREYENSNYEDPEPKEPDVTEIILRHTASLREAYREELRAAREALEGVLNSAVHPDIAKRSVMVDLAPIRKVLARAACKGGDAV